MRYCLRTIGIVKVEYRSLHPNARSTAARRMVGITFNFDGMSLAAFHEHAGCKLAKLHSARIKERFTRDQALGLADIRQNFVWLLFGTGGQSCESQRYSGHFQKISAADSIPPFGGSGRKFAMQHFLQFRCLREFLQTAPLLLALVSLKFRSKLF